MVVNKIALFNPIILIFPLTLPYIYIHTHTYSSSPLQRSNYQCQAVAGLQCARDINHIGKLHSHMLKGVIHSKEDRTNGYDNFNGKELLMEARDDKTTNI